MQEPQAGSRLMVGGLVGRGCQPLWSPWKWHRWAPQRPLRRRARCVLLSLQGLELADDRSHFPRAQFEHLDLSALADHWGDDRGPVAFREDSWVSRVFDVVPLQPVGLALLGGQ